MVQSIKALTPEQRAQMPGWADKWIEIGLRTGSADRAKFESAAQKCYGFAGLPWPGRVVWVSSPMVLAIAAPAASLLLSDRTIKPGPVLGAARDVAQKVAGGLLNDAVVAAICSAAAVSPEIVPATQKEGKRVREAIRGGWAHFIGGQFWAGGWWMGAAYASFFREVCDLELPGDLWERSLAYEATVESACWWCPHSNFVMVCERPAEIHRELADPNRPRGWGSHRLHHDTRAAVSWADGWGVYAVHGVRIPFERRHIVESPGRITVAEIEAETNAELRRVLIERYGTERYVVDSGATVVHSLPADYPVAGLRTARLLRKDVRDDEPIVYVDVLNSTPEPDGTHRRYMLRVDPSAYGGDAARNAHAAVASTWRNHLGGPLTYADWRDYAPAAES